MMGRLSLHARIGVIAMLSALLTLAACGYLLKFWVSHVVSENVNDMLDAQVMMLRRAIGPDGTLRHEKLHFVPELYKPHTQWGWSFSTPGHSEGGGTPIREVTRFPGLNQYEDGIYSAHAQSPSGHRLHARLMPLDLERNGQRVPATIMIAAPDELIQDPESEGLRLVIGSLAILALFLAGSSLLLVHFGLRPVRTLGRDVARVRDGDLDRLPEDGQPRELLPLVSEVNALVAQNGEQLRQTRLHVANLAHGLKAPLATLALELETEGAGMTSRALVAQLDKRIVHHLRRARVAAAGVGDRARADLVPVGRDLAFTMGRLHGARGLEVAVEAPDSCEVPIDPEDLDEMLGNLLDNACRLAGSIVRLSIAAEGAMARVAVEDDGPGIAPRDVPVALTPGVRLDETGQGFGFGLAIVRELVELYGGSLQLGHSTELGGLCAVLLLPRRV
ncbi:HAMP domain-containing sensor histidine kinase [Novosphingobium sp. BL-8A]|uniref:sensor histidine kinase n=1 Tax=Novosphingobium sp. BL-8A TaxID=3127639 RepID=UPI003757AECA